MRLRKAKLTENELRSLNEKRRTRALTRWEQLSTVPDEDDEPTYAEEQRINASPSRKHGRTEKKNKNNGKSGSSEKGKEKDNASSSSSGSDNDSDSERDEDEQRSTKRRNRIDWYGPSTVRTGPTPAKLLQQMEQANAMNRFFDALGGRES